MLNLTIEGKNYNAPTSWEEITFNQFRKFNRFIYSEHNKPKTEKILLEGINDDNEAELLEYFIDCIDYLTDIPKSVLVRVRRFTKADEISIEDLFLQMSFLFVFPTIKEPKPIDKINNYYFIDKLDVNNAILKDASFAEYTESNFVARVYNEIESGNEDYLSYLLAIMYRPKNKKYFWSKEVFEEWDGEKIKDRAKEFEGLTMDIYWNCLFFFMQLRTKLLKSTTQSLEEEGAAQKDFLTKGGI